MGLKKGHISYNLKRSGFDLIGVKGRLICHYVSCPLCLDPMPGPAPVGVHFVTEVPPACQAWCWTRSDKHQALSKGPWLPRGVIAMM